MKTRILEIFEKAMADISNAELELIINVIAQLDSGEVRVCEKINKNWVTHEWVKKAILLYFRTQKNSLIETENWNYFDKIPVKKWNGTEGVRVVPPAVARRRRIGRRRTA